MIKVYIGEILERVPVVEILHPNFHITEENHSGYYRVFVHEKICEIVEKVEEADFLMFPHNFNYIKGNEVYLKKLEDISRQNNKKTIVFFPGDSVSPAPLENSIVFRNSQYRSELKSNEIIMPGYVSDLSRSNGGIKLVNKKVVPVVGFCGWADFRTTGEWIRYSIKVFISLAKSVMFGDIVKTRIKGIWWRRRILRSFGSKSQCSTNFIVRKSYSGNKKTIIGDQKKNMEEYIENIVNSNYSLCVKGDGNFSTRFYEVLSLGRIPVFVDTECVLPLEKEISYDDFVLRIGWREINKIDSKVFIFNSVISDGEYLNKQKIAREMFEKFLSIDSFFRFVFTQEFLSKYK